MEDHDAAAIHYEQRLADGEACLEAAIFYLSIGWSVLALCPPDHAGVGKEHAKTCKGNAGKRPLGFWKEYQERLPTESELRAKWSQVAGANVGVALGPVSNLIRVDVEGEEGEKALLEKSKGDLPKTLEFKSGRADGTGRGLLYKIPPGANLRTTSEAHGAKQELRLQARGAQTVLPPSRHKDGNLYAWKDGHSPGVIDAAMAPAWLVAELTSSSAGGNRREGGKDLDEILDGAEEGSRNENAASFIGRLLLSVSDVTNSATIRLQWGIAKIWNNQNDPPLPDEELQTTFNSILRAERNRRERLDENKLDQYIREQVQKSVEDKKDDPKEANGRINGFHSESSNGNGKHEEAKKEPAKENDPGWKLVIVETDPKEFRLRGPEWANSPKLIDGYLILTEKQIRYWSNGPEGIPQAAYSQALVTIDPVYKGWSKPGGPLDLLTRGAKIIDVAPENKKLFYMLGFFYRYLATATTLDREDGRIVEWPSSGRPTIRDDGAVCFKLENLKKSIMFHKEDFGIRTITRAIEDFGVEQSHIQNSRWWIVPPSVLKKIGEVTREGI